MNQVRTYAQFLKAGWLPASILKVQSRKSLLNLLILSMIRLYSSMMGEMLFCKFQAWPGFILRAEALFQTPHHTFAGIPHFIVLCDATPILYFLQIEGCIEPVYRCHFSNSFCSLCVSVSHFGNSCNISKPPPAKR